MRGFTLVEIVITLGVLTALLTLTGVSLLSSRQHTSLNSAAAEITADLKGQQAKAMVGDTAGSGAVSPYGTYFSAGSYTLFKGSVYSPADPDNFEVSLEPSQTFSSPGLTVVFNSGSGEIVGFIPGGYIFTLADSLEGISKTFNLNRYGVITSIN